MSEGPIKRWRDSYKPPVVSTDPKKAIHLIAVAKVAAYCGSRVAPVLAYDLSVVNCADCLAAHRADEAAI